ncbi:peptide/nickel transport system substrate-binding protein [Lutibacter sp. Hel_I_33_5]|uniref:ABC transporter substrate-binding protein n=1 Tax=Lutibacter sp. Hel_I_33_5 TaxID=1566289 RepID=UPI0011ACD314|nr:ABC transporter substrate-binding protein [Lutibacter sp. Hel_I_33_5]TVZ55119.1 peptide/nickel transport system substrate-binding protein [Lutibacter sp. Hel_I_33_5]
MIRTQKIIFAKIKFKNNILLSTIVAFILLLFSCTQEQSKFDDTQVFRYNEHKNINTLDPAFSKDLRTIWATTQLFNGLVQLNDSLEVEPDIAKSWTISDDGIHYDFNLRKDIQFHKHILFGKDSTRNVVAKDFEYSFNRLIDPKVASTGKWVLEFVDRFKAKNDSTFSITLKKPFPPFLSLLSMKYCSVVPKEAIDYFGDRFRANPIGTGPFTFKLWVENTKLVFRKNKFYHEKDDKGNQLPYVEAVAITFLPDKQSEFLQFIQGNLDFLNSIDVSYKDDLLTSKGQLQTNYTDKINMISSPYLNTEYLGVYTDSEEKEANAIKIRKAMNYGFDRVKMIKYLRNGIGTPAINGFIPKGLPSFSNMKGYTYQPKKAEQLIKEYIEESGNSSPAITVSTDSQYLDLCEFVQREMQKIGLKVIVEVLPPSTLREQKAKGQLSIFRGSWVADYPDAENYLFIYHSKNFSPKGPNYTHYSSEIFDNLYEEAVQTLDVKKRHFLYRKMDSLVMDSAPVIPLYYDVALRFTHKNVKDLGINPINHLVLKNVKKTK